MKTLNNLINLRGMREQSFKFAMGYKRGMKSCFTRGCEIFVPLSYALKDNELSAALYLDRVHNGEQGVNLEFCDDLLGDISMESASETAFFRSHPELNP